MCLIVCAGGREIFQRDARYSREERSGIIKARFVFSFFVHVGVPFFILYIFCLVTQEQYVATAGKTVGDCCVPVYLVKAYVERAARLQFALRA